MSASHSTITYKVTLYIIILFFLHFELLAESRIVLPKKMISSSPPPPPLNLPKPPSTLNRYKKMELNAFRPTCEGRSPGMGHDDPPGRRA
ncbi:hypothetical protein M9H77_25403 [Catharanthus roseus]|uniref:Uncharacterized protein n=1 Tax=Catharanthus roseus TaxID=4058 RepID=A0ACC0A884_CATRO|nr:hypothetical protein M9H77_25403 [Catharanthus roseus]